jgi:hypothetical protein
LWRNGDRLRLKPVHCHPARAIRVCEKLIGAVKATLYDAKDLTGLQVRGTATATFD